MIAKLLHMWVSPEDKALQDDGACPACDHPFGQMKHICFGPLTMSARVPDRKRDLTPQR